MTEAGICLRDVSFGYGREPVIQGITLEIPAGSITAVVGPNGVGKSTLLKIMSGYLKSQGSIMVRGNHVGKLSPQERSKIVTYVGDEPIPAYDFTVEETVIMGRYSQSGHDNEELWPIMKHFHVYDIKDRLITGISSGERKRVSLARAFYQNPQVYLLDEPTAHLDVSYELIVMGYLSEMARQSHKTIICVLHDLNLALRYASVIVFLKEGKVYCIIQPGQINCQIIRDVYGVEADIVRHPYVNYPYILSLAPIGSRHLYYQ